MQIGYSRIKSRAQVFWLQIQCSALHNTEIEQGWVPLHRKRKARSAQPHRLKTNWDSGDNAASFSKNFGNKRKVLSNKVNHAHREKYQEKKKKKQHRSIQEASTKPTPLRRQLETKRQTSYDFILKCVAPGGKFGSLLDRKKDCNWTREWSQRSQCLSLEILEATSSIELN